MRASLLTHILPLKDIDESDAQRDARLTRLRVELRDKYLVKALLESSPTKMRLSMSQGFQGTGFDYHDTPEEIGDFLVDLLKSTRHANSNGNLGWDLSKDEIWCNGEELTDYKSP